MLAVAGVLLSAGAGVTDDLVAFVVRYEGPNQQVLDRLPVQALPGGGYQLGDPVTVGPLGREISGTTLTPSGELLALDPQNDLLLRVDTQTGAASPLATLDLDLYEGASDLAVGPDGRLWLANGSSLYHLDPATGTTTLVGDTGLWISALAGLNHKLYAADGCDLYEVDPATCQAHWVFDFCGGGWIYCNIVALASDGQRLWVLSMCVMEPGPPYFPDLETFDPVTGANGYLGEFASWEPNPVSIDIARVRSGPAIPAVTLPGALILVGALALAGVALLRLAKA